MEKNVIKHNVEIKLDVEGYKIFKIFQARNLLQELINFNHKTFQLHCCSNITRSF